VGFAVNIVIGDLILDHLMLPIMMSLLLVRFDTADKVQIGTVQLYSLPYSLPYSSPIALPHSLHYSALRTALFTALFTAICTALCTALFTVKPDP
jgi:hypothetical protein